MITLSDFLGIIASLVTIIGGIVIAVRYIFPKISDKNRFSVIGITLAVILVLVVSSFFVTRTVTNAAGGSKTIFSNSLQPTATVSSHPIPTDGPTLIATSTPIVQPSATVANGLITEDLTLTTCSGCNDAIHVTINTIQIDSANGRMIWNTTLRDVTNSSIGYSIYQYYLQANASQTQISAVLSQTSMNGDNTPYGVQAIFAFLPSHGVTYTLTVIVAWNNSYIRFDPAQVSF